MSGENENEFDIVPADDDSGQRQRLQEFEEVLKDFDHSHHDDAVCINKKLAEALAPADKEPPRVVHTPVREDKRVRHDDGDADTPLTALDRLVVA